MEDVEIFSDWKRGHRKCDIRSVCSIGDLDTKFRYLSICVDAHNDFATVASYIVKVWSFSCTPFPSILAILIIRIIS